MIPDHANFAAAFGSAVLIKSPKDDLVAKNEELSVHDLFRRVFPKV